MKHAIEVIDDIWKQRCDLMIKHYEPKLEILIHEEDMKTILVEKLNYDISMVFGPTFEWENLRPKRMFGETLIIINHPSMIGEPLVAIRERREYERLNTRRSK